MTSTYCPTQHSRPDFQAFFFPTGLSVPHKYLIYNCVNCFRTLVIFIHYLEMNECTSSHPRVACISSLWGWWGPGPGCPEKLWLPPPWQCWRPGWMGLWETWSVEGVPAHGRGVGTGWSIRSFPTQTILWFYAVKVTLAEYKSFCWKTEGIYVKKILKYLH